VETQDWGDVETVLGYELEPNEAYAVELDGIEGVFVLLPEAFLEKFRRDDEVEVCGYDLWPRWGNGRFMIGPREHIGSIHTISRCQHWTIELNAHRVRHSSRSISEIKQEVDDARSYKRRVTIRIEKI
jgi:hypothetical protein